jgi:hypothetical protein
MGGLEWCVLIHYDVYFDVISLTCMICTNLSLLIRLLCQAIMRKQPNEPTVSTFKMESSWVTVIYITLDKNSFGADFPTNNQTCSKAFETHDVRMRRPIKMAPMGSRYQTNLSPTMLMTKPKTLTTRSLRWSIFSSSVVRTAAIGEHYSHRRLPQLDTSEG